MEHAELDRRPRLLRFSVPSEWHAPPIVRLTERDTEFDEDEVRDELLVLELDEEVLREFTDEQIADAYDRFRAVARSTILPDRDSLLAWVRECRIDTPYEHGPLPLEQQVDEHNELEEDTREEPDFVRVENGTVVPDAERNRRAWATELSFRAAQVVAARRPVVRLRDRGRSRRGHRVTRRSTAHAPDREPPPPDLARPGRAFRRGGAS